MDPVTGLSLGRVAVGVLALARPDVLATALGLAPAADDGRAVLGRLFGVREVALGATTLVLAGRPDARGTALRAGVLVDLGDALVAIGSHRAGSVRTPGAAALTAVALGAAVVGAGAANGTVRHR